MDLSLVDVGWHLLFDEPRRDASVLRAAARDAGYEGSLARAFVFTAADGGDRTREILVAPGASGEWEILTSLE